MSISASVITGFKGNDLSDLCESTEQAIKDGIGFNWLTPPGRDVLEQYWNGVLMVPQRVLIGGWVDSVLSGAVQLVTPGKSKETSSFAAEVEAHFVAPWARGHGLAKTMLQCAEREARKAGYTVLKLSVRETQEAAIHLYEENGYVRWGVLPYYEFVNARMVAGHFFYKHLEPISRL